ncbi:MAG TPA: tRNA 2-thiouridine(34) synthase MnmA [Chlamydiales bacterium]|nr:tRNA 2-thiouridine(34) synthase MnmA [Chlamydiales bacterium]
MHKKKVAIAISGGVDSSVAACLLKEQGYDVFGLFMKNWEEKDSEGRCTTETDFQDAKAVCEKLDIPYYSVNFAKEYQENVFQSFIEELKEGYTPNPDILCNREIKFKVLFNKAMALGADFLATGHYCQVAKTDTGYQLKKGLDANKDQTYFLYTIKSEILEKVLFPIGHLEKKEVREIAKKNDLITHSKKDSTGICFIGKRNFQTFINQYIESTKGDFKTPEGKIVGKHMGHPFYTIGQRKGLAIGGPGEPWFVVDKDPKTNTVIVAQGEHHSALYAEMLIADNISWVGPEIKAPFKCAAKIRYRQTDTHCTIEKIENDQITVSFDNPQRAITPRQSIVFYHENICLGGAMIIKKLTPASIL